MLGHCGISLAADVLDLAVLDRIVDKSGSWFNYGETRLGQGRDKARTFLEENPGMLQEIKLKVLTAQGVNPNAPVVPAESNGQQVE